MCVHANQPAPALAPRTWAAPGGPLGCCMLRTRGAAAALSVLLNCFSSSSCWDPDPGRKAKASGWSRAREKHLLQHQGQTKAKGQADGG